jgi:hypothetical protein
MAQSVPFGGLADFYISAIQTALGRTLRERGPQQAAALQLLKKGMIQGPFQDARQALDRLTPQTELPPERSQPLFAGIMKLAALTPELLKDSVRSDTLEKSVGEMYAVGVLVEEIGQPDMAYNLFETAYHLATVLQKPCLKVAKKLRQLSNPDNVSQHHAAIWRFATAMLEECLSAFKSPSAMQTRPTNNDWIAALDAVELALNVYVDSHLLQQQLCDQFVAVMRQAQGTPVEDLVVIYPTQIDPGYIDADMKRKMIEALAGSRPDAGDPPSRIAALELWAAVKGQTMLDDVRLQLSERYHGRPNLSWHDLTLQHQNLLQAVPLQQSLVIDVDRTGELVLELTHEIAHAYCLLGPIGWAITAFRVAAHCCELLIDSSNTAGRADGLADLGNNPALLELAEIQLASSYRSALHEAIWTPWLEGVAQYIEMLADPKDDPREIMAIHEAVRSLVDFPFTPAAGESLEAFTRRYGQESAKRFEDFYAEALNRASRLRQIGYLQPNARREVYLFGYLLVRSVVARWEVTLGRRIEPVKAAKLLLNATRNGTHGLDWGLECDPDDFYEHASKVFQEWVAVIAAIDRESLETFFEDVPSDSRGHKYHWKDGRPRRVSADGEQARAAIYSSWTAFQHACAGLVAGKGLRHTAPSTGLGARVATEHRQVIADLFAHYLETISLLPVGKDMSRLVLFNDGRALVCPRTYVGLEQPKHDDSLPRYSVRSFALAGGAAETESLRRACGRLGTARLYVTRIIDLTGHANSPDQRPNLSYVCLFLGDKWHRVTLGDSQHTDGFDEGFIDALRRRVLYPPFPNEAETLRSVTALARRLLGVKKDSHYGAAALSLDKDALSLDVGLKAVARAFGSTDGEVKDATASTLSAAKFRIDLADYLFLTGKGGQSDGNHPALSAPLASLALSQDSASGIKPFGGSHA